jgi:hypothetical protein
MDSPIQTARDPRYTATLEWLQKSETRAQLAKEHLGKWLVAVDRAVAHVANTQAEALAWMQTYTPDGIAVLWHLQVEAAS